jgi:pilus assembly protein CpaB
VAVAMLMLKVIGRRPEVKQEVVNTTPTTDVLIAAKDLPMGTKLGDGAVIWKAWPKDNLLQSMVTRDAKPDAIKELALARARQLVFKDEPLLDKKFVLPGQAGFMSANIPKGMRAISVAISLRSSAGGFILPNDRVDVILTRKLNDGKTPVTVVKSETVISNVRVLAVNQVFKQAQEGDAVSVEKGETATLELTPKQTEILAMVESSGELSLALRSIAENDGKSADQINPMLSDKFEGKSRREGGDPLFVRAGIQSYAIAQ